MSWGVNLAGLAMGLVVALIGVACVRHARKLGNATIDFEMNGPVKQPAWHGNQASRRTEIGQYRIVGAILAVIGGLVFSLCAVRLLILIMKFVSE